MLSQRTKHIIAWSFLGVFLILKVSGLHEFTHHSKADVEHCILCQVSSRDNLTPALSTENAISITVFKEFIEIQILDFYENLTSEKFKPSELVNRPPPFYTVS